MRLDNEKITSSQKRSKTVDNGLVNSLSEEEIDEIIRVIFTKLYVRGKQGRRSREISKLDYPVPYCLEFNGHLWANPYAFSWTKSFKKGYPCIPWKSDSLKIFAPHSTNTKSSWVPRLLVHCVMWRYYNNYAMIPEGKQVSHITDQALLLSPHLLCIESGEINRSRVACRIQCWYDEIICGSDPKRSRCPHWENPCRPPIDTGPSAEIFAECRNPIGFIPKRDAYI